MFNVILESYDGITGKISNLFINVLFDRMFWWELLLQYRRGGGLAPLARAGL